jgi:two-component system catabolic regulation response regulator CreB
VRKPLILLVEDEPDIALIVSLCLPPERFALACAVTLGEARGVLRLGLVPDMVVLDIGLPDGDGLTLCRELKAERPDLPVAVVTADVGEPTRQRSSAAGADRFLGKPFAPDEFCATLDELLGLPQASA